ncbi:MAG: aspartate-semialdehyde dehydrogenase [Aquificae bacterium]|nr:aspartate-semialdehyde dehydrogenase [Aquificota bacterium]
MKGYRVAVVGVTGEVGKTFLKVLQERNFPVRELVPIASARSRGKKVVFRGEEYEVRALEDFDSFKGIDLALFSAGGSTSKEWAPKFAADGAVVVDNSSAWRMDPKVPLVVPEVNPDDVKWHDGIIANPNCSTIQMVVALKPIYDEAGVKNVVVSTYQAVSGAGAKAVADLLRQTVAFVEELKKRGLSEEDVSPEALEELFKDLPPAEKFPHQIAFNALPHIDRFFDDGYTREENKMLFETRKIMHDESINVSATCVRVPVFYGHSESVSIETEREISPERAREVLRRAPGVVVVDDPSKNEYPLPIRAAGRDEVFVGRIRKDRVFNPGLSMWVVADNIRKGAATNAVQIAELLIKYGLI